MKTILITGMLLLLFSGGNVTLTVIAKNVQIGKGPVVVEIWESEEKFFKTPYAAKSLDSDKTSVIFSFDLKEGRYAISVYQDLNNNGKLDLGMFHKPAEPVGFGNNFRPRFSAPKYEDCAVDLNRALTQEIELK
jgi:uncharacterized protein (DUF2141 family)